MAEKKLDIIIVGGSLAGLMHGIVAKRAGHNVTILEQYLSSQREGQAAGIVTLEFFHKYLTVYDQLQNQPYAVLCQGVQNLDRKLSLQSQYKLPLKMSSWNVLYHRLRANFDGLPSSYCEHPPAEKPEYGEGSYKDGQIVTGIEHASRKVRVACTDVRKAGSGSQTMEADLLIAADGSISSLRRLVQPRLDFSYAGYVAWRGTVLEESVSDSARQTINLMTTLCTSDHGYIAMYDTHLDSDLQALQLTLRTDSYTIPGENGTLEPGKRLINYVWYTNLDKSDLPRVMTDSDGRTHRHTLPIGKMREDVWARQKQIATDIFPEAVAELINKTTQPFISAIVDVPVSQPVLFDGKLLFVGDSLCAFRPHVASSTNQAAYDALLFAQFLKGDISLSSWASHVVDFAHRTRLRSVTWGDWYQYNYFWFALSKGRYILAECYSHLTSRLFGSVSV